MPKRLSRERIEQIRAEVKAFNRGDRQCDPGPPTVRKTLSCGHEGEVKPGIDPSKAICGQCRAKGVRSVRE